MPLDVVAELPTTWVTASVEAPLPGYVCVVSKKHVVEPFDLTPDDQTAFWSETMLVARAVATLLRPSRINYEIHGNTVAHLHVHLLSRYDGDPFEGEPIDFRRASFARSKAQLADIAASIEAPSAARASR